MRTYLAITPKALSQLPAPPPLPLVHMAYAVGQGGCLTRCAAANLPHGGLMGLSDRCSGSIPRTDALCRAIAAECVRRGFQGVLADFESPAHTDRPFFLTQLAGQLASHGLILFSPLILPAEGATLLIGTGISGGSLRVLLEENINRYGAARLALDLERVQMDFPLPCPTGCGTPLRHEELLALQQKHHASIYYSRELAANYFTYPTERGTHFVLFDDAETLRRKVRLAESYDIRDAFIMYPEICDLLSSPET